MKPITLAVCAAPLLLALSPLAAQAAQSAFTNQAATLRAGPSPDYPLVTELPAGVPLEVEGCTASYRWCDVLLPDGLRGWLDAQSLSHRSQGQQVVISQVGSVIGIPVLTFDVGQYWGAHYRNRPYYREPRHWHGRPQQLYAQSPREELFPAPSYIGRAPGIISGQNPGVQQNQPPAMIGRPQQVYPQAPVYGGQQPGWQHNQPGYGHRGNQGYGNPGYGNRGYGNVPQQGVPYPQPNGGWQGGQSPPIRGPQPWGQVAPPLQPPLQQIYPGQQLYPNQANRPGYMQR